ncbi:MAG TPA: PA2779 family protein [Syntrophorhabdaceae bacterium]|nr:PA2779 family protein [Syntrophorhabdaceae bacterium]
MAKKYVTWYLVLSMMILGVAPRVEAAFSPSETLKFTGMACAADIETIRAALENKIVSQRLKDLGFSSEEIASRLSQLDDRQLHDTAKKIDDLRVGKDAGVGVLIAVLIIVLIVVLVLQMSGRRIRVTR